MINTVRSVTDVPLYVDVNQGWKDKNHALEMIHWLKEKGVEFVEQPMPKTQIDDMAWLTENSPLPTIADEAFDYLDAPVTRVCGLDVPAVPFAPPMEHFFLPNAEKITRATRKVLEY